MIDALKTLQKDAWRTSSARYNAARRLRRRETFATVSLAFMSALTVAIAYLQKVYATSAMPADNYLSTVSAALGVFLLTVSLVEWGTKTGAVAETLHGNAEKLNGFWRRVRLAVSASESGSPPTMPTLQDVQKYQLEYDALKADCSHNHLPIDDLFFRADHRFAPEFLNGRPAPSMNALEAGIAWCRWQISSIWYIAGIWLLLAALLLPLFSETMWTARTALTPLIDSPVASQSK
jgi:hypothetical protein